MSLIKTYLVVFCINLLIQCKGNVFLQDLSTLWNKDWTDCLFGKTHTYETAERNHNNRSVVFNRGTAEPLGAAESSKCAANFHI